MPELSVLVPLEDTRGEAAEHVRTWTHEQSLPRDRYQMVIASPADDGSQESAIEDLLAPQDVLERVPGGRLQELWNAAAARAEADWLVLTESHCEADPACLAAIARAIADSPENEAFTLQHGHISVNDIAELCARWFGVIYDGWSQPGEWARLNLVGVAIRRDAFERMGRLDARYGGFSAPLLSARLQEQGGRVGHIGDALVLHVHNEDIRDHHRFSVDYAIGECETRTREDRVFCERYFGPNYEWTNRQRYHPVLARHRARVLASSAGRAVLGRREEIPWLLRELGGAATGAVAGVRGRLARERVGFRIRELLARRLRLAPEARWRSFLEAHDRVVVLARLEWIRHRSEPLAPPEPIEGEVPVEGLGHQTLIGVYGLERDGDRWFRWSEPVTVLRFARPREQRVLRIDTGGRHGDPTDRLRAVYVDGRRVSPDAIRGEGSNLLVPLAPGRVDGDPTTVTILRRPFEPGRSGSGDPRRLGMPIVSVGL